MNKTIGIGIFFIAAIFCAGFSVLAYNEGNQFGYTTGHDIGYTTGHDIGYTTGHDIGYDSGFDSGETKGYRKGYVKGVEDTEVNQFRSVGELTSWLYNNKISERQYITTYYDCDDFAVDLVRAARADGYEIFICATDYHMFNMCQINGIWYIIEPQTDQVWYLGVEL